MTPQFRAIFVASTSALQALVFCGFAQCQTLPVDSPKAVPAISPSSEKERFRDTSPVLPIIFPALNQNMPLAPFAPVPIPVTVPLDSASPLRPANLSVSQMRGEVHFKHLEGPKLDPSRALYIETGTGISFCEFKMTNCTGRAWANSQVAVFPESDVIFLSKGAMVIQAKRESGSRFTLLAGDLSCRIEGCTVRVQKDESSVNFQVLDSTQITVYNRKTGEIIKASKITVPSH